VGFTDATQDAVRMRLVSQSQASSFISARESATKCVVVGATDVVVFATVPSHAHHAIMSTQTDSRAHVVHNQFPAEFVVSTFKPIVILSAVWSSMIDCHECVFVMGR